MACIVVLRDFTSGKPQGLPLTCALGTAFEDPSLLGLELLLRERPHVTELRELLELVQVVVRRCGDDHLTWLKMVAIRVPAGFADTVDTVAEAAGTTRFELIRQAVVQSLLKLGSPVGRAASRE